IEVDPLRLEQVITNLLDNAVKFSPDGGPIQIEITSDNQQVCISVTDHGIGISLEHHPKIFNRFYQANTISHLGGMGLGLFISRQIIQLHGGSIDFESLPEGGTRFTMT